MKQILIAAVLLALLAIQANTCFLNGCLPIRPPKIPINCPFLPKPRPSPPPPQQQPQPPQPPRDQPLSNKFTLTLSYACRPRVPFQSCLGEVVWNDAIIFSIVPRDYNFQHLRLQVTAKDGRNTLQFVGAGTSDFLGLLIDDVKLIRQGTSHNIVVNGDFQHPYVDNWQYFDNIEGWRGKGIQVGNGPKAYGVGNKQYCELDSDRNYQMSQDFTFNHLYQQVGNRDIFRSERSLKYNLEFDWAIRQSNTHPDTSKANVIWNDVVVASLQDDCNRINHANIEVDLRIGDNTVQFDGTSFSDHYGISIDNVRLTSRFDSTNLIVNGDFSDPCVGSGWKMFNGGIPGWSAVLAEVGDAGNYNCNWRTGQVIELDSDSNQRYTQVIKISDSLFAQLQRQANSPIRCHPW